MAELTTKEVAEAVGTSPKALRKFLRLQVTEAGGTIGEDTPGKGKRYAFDKKEVAQIKRDYSAWMEAQAQRRAEKLAAAEAEEDAEEIELEDEDELVDED